MKIELEVLAYTSIKRRKPWPQIQWVGKEKESLILLDENRVSVLYIPSGKTKRKIPKLSPLAEESLTISRTPNGYYLLGLLKSGDIFLWNKDNDIIKTISGLSDHIPVTTLLTEKCSLYSSDDCSKILLVVGSNQFIVWNSSHTESVFNQISPLLNGQWNTVLVPDNIQLASTDCLEISTTGIFYNSQICGCCCHWSVIFNFGALVCVSSLLLRFPSNHEMLTENCPSVRTEWCCLQYPVERISPGCEPINSRGAYVSCCSKDGQLLAVAVNQRSPLNSAMMFVSPLTDTILVSEFRGCGLKEPEKKKGRQYWVKDMEWTTDQLFIACILNNGCVALLSRLGEPLAIHISGCSIDMGPNYFLSLHPLIQIQSDNGSQTVTDVLAFLNDPMSQKFSVTSHPSLPILLFSDGFNITAIQLPAELTSTSFMRDLVLESTKHLEYLKKQSNLDLTLANAYNFSKMQTASKRRTASNTSTVDKLKRFLTNFDDDDQSLNESQVSELSTLLDEEYQHGGMQDISSGKILFGDEDHLATMERSLATTMDDKQALLKHFQHARLNLFTVWKMAATCTDNWTSNLDTIVKHAVKNIYKMFTLMMNSDSVTSMLAEQNSSAQNGCLVNVISMYRQLLDVLQFDSLEQHLIPPTLQLAHKTINLILNNRNINQSDPRLKTLSGCYMLLKFTEKIMNRNYIWLPQSLVEKGISPRTMLSRSDQFIPATKADNYTTVHQIPSDQLSAKRLTSTWKLLYQALLDFRRDQTISEADIQQSQLLVNAIHQTLEMVETEILGKSAKINQGDAFSLDGHYTQALDVWLQQYRSLHGKGGYHKAAKLLHSLLYTFIMRGELLTAVEFIDELVVKANTRMAGNTTKGDSRQALMTLVTSTLRSQCSNIYDEVPCIHDKDIRQVVQTMARFMACYFSNQSIYVFPPHNPQVLPPVHYNTPLMNNRIIPQYSEEMAQIIRCENLSDIWTVERTLEYLLLSGLVCEATWFADKMGDWKAAFLLSVACEQHKQTAVSLYTKPRKPLSLPNNLTPLSILQDRLGVLLGVTDDISNTDCFSIDNEFDLDKLTKTIKELLMAGIMCKVEVAPWLLSGLVHKVKRIIRQLQPLVPADFYLPSPPLYCPQPSNSKQHTAPPGVEKEERIREKISSLVQLIFAVLSGSHLSLPCMTWYTQQLAKIQEKAKQFRANTEGPCLQVPTILQQYLSHKSHLVPYAQHHSTQLVLTSFRDFTSLLWLLHARDKLSLKLRQKEKYLNQLQSAKSKDQLQNGDEQQEWIQEIFTTLQWAVHLLSFSHYLSDESCMYKIVLSLLMELPPSEDTADILAEHYYDIENLDPEIQEKLEKILAHWETIIVTPEDDGRSAKYLNDDSGTDVRKSVTFYRASPRGKSLSTYYSKQCHTVSKVLRKKARKFGSFEEFIFSNINAVSIDEVDLNIGSRQFETKQSYFEFLDTLAAVSFEKLLDLERSVNRPRDLPLLGCFADAIISKELAVFSEKDLISAEKKKYSLVVLSSTRSSCRSSPAFARSQSILTQRYNSNYSLNQDSPQPKPQGLFRSKSVVEGKNIKQGMVKRYNSEGCGLDVITEDSPSKSYLNNSPRSQKKDSQQNLSKLASKFSQSEDALYKPDIDENNSWSLDVNFGRKYRLLQLLLEWLEVWCRKNHEFGMFHQNVSDSRPTIKIQIPSQLILLSLWLLEYKYNVNPAAVQDVGQGFIGESQPKKNKSSIEKLNKTEIQSRTLSPKHILKQSDRMCEEDGVKMNTFEEDGIRNAYEHILDGENENSSMSISSLQSGEVGQTLSIIPGTGSPTREELSFLNHTVYPNSSPDRGTSSPKSGTPVSKHRTNKSKTNSEPSEKSIRALDYKKHSRKKKHHRSKNGCPRKGVPLNDSSRGSSPNRSRNISIERSSILKASLTSSLERSTSPRNTKLHTVMNSRSISPQISIKSTRSRSQSPETRRQSGHVSRQESHQQSPHFDSGFNSNLASQLQNIVRSEMRRIMEVQHKSLLAMMGAIDDPNSSMVPSITAQSSLQRKNTHDHRRKSPPQQYSHDSQHSTVDHSMNLDELEPLQRSSDSRGRQGSIKVDRALLELKNLQNESVKPILAKHHTVKSLDDKENTVLPLLGLEGVRYIRPVNTIINDSHVNQINIIPKFLRITAERDINQPHFFFPKLSDQAQSEVHQRTVPFKEPMKLLKLQESAFSFFENLSNQTPILPPTSSRQTNSTPTCRSLKHTSPHTQTSRFGIQLLHLEKRQPPYIEIGKEAEFGQLVNPQVVLSPEQLLQRIEYEQIQKTEQTKRQQIVEDVTTKMNQEEIRQRIIKPLKAQSEVKQAADLSLSEEEDSDSERDSDEENQQIHDGYVFKPGEFNSQLRLEEILGPGADTDTKFEYMLALKMQQQREQKKKKVDFSTMTKEMIDAIAEPDPILEAEAWTSISKNTSSDPIHEAVKDYNKLQENVVPPDIYLKLGFNDGQHENDERGRSYLNVVDIRASAVFNDIPERDELQSDIEPYATPLSLQPNIESVEESLREKLRPLPPQRRYGYDSVTAKMLDRKNQNVDNNGMYLRMLPQENVRFSKTALIKRLRDMNEQVEAIDEMSLNIQQDFESSRRIMNTIQTLEEADQPKHTERDKTSTQQSFDDKLTPQMSAKSHVTSSYTSLSQSPGHQQKTVHKSADLSTSGLSEIIGEILLDGGVDLQEAGLSNTEAELLKQRARSRKYIYGSTGIDKLEELIQQTGSANDETENKRILHKWMSERRFKQQEEYRLNLDRLREQEVQPYKPTERYNTTLTARELDSQIKERKETRRIKEEEFMKQRFLQAEKLMGDILVDRKTVNHYIPSSRKSLSSTPVQDKPKKYSQFGTTRTIKKSPPSKKASLQSILKTSEFNRKARQWENMKSKPTSLKSKWRVDGRRPAAIKAANQTALFQKQQEEYERRLKEERLAEIAERYNMEDIDMILNEQDEFIPSVSLSEDLMEYAKNIANQESCEDIIKSPDEHKTKIEYKPKPYNQIVKLQRPEITRKEIDMKPSESYIDRLASQSPRNSTTDRSITDTRYLHPTLTPASVKSPSKPEISGIRRVKTYAERLQEMKSTPKYSTPLVPKQSLGGSTNRQMVMKPTRRTGPPHKPLTYVQQLQKINKDVPKTKAKKSTRIPAKTFMRSHKPIHKPQTYVEQLKTINSKAPETRRSLMQRTKTLQSGVIREQARSRPYNDPYHDIEEDELHSVLSSWSVDDDVRKLLYDDASLSYMGNGGISPDYQQSEGVSDYYEVVMADQYSASVDIDEIARIADAASVDSGSVMSVIDWDVIDDLIATVHE